VKVVGHAQAAAETNMNPASGAGPRRQFAVGERRVIADNDGEFIMEEGFLNRPGFQHLFDGPDGVARLPIGCFALPGEINVLIDAGLGPRAVSGVLRGGALLDGLACCGLLPGDIDRIALSHLHEDHCGWLANDDAEPVFANAEVFVGRGDWEYFVEGEKGRIAEPTAVVLGLLADLGRLTLLDDEQLIAPGLTAIPAPGHTPGHTIYAIHDRGDRALVLGDAMYCPQQLTDIDLTAMHDVDKDAARRTRELIQRDLDRHGSQAVGCHFAGLGAGRVIGGSWTSP
jgi:glyoxylase-like metal-dependent hydrolase (beta-lactamase superfamily II)